MYICEECSWYSPTGYCSGFCPVIQEEVACGNPTDDCNAFNFKPKKSINVANENEEY